LPAWLAVKVQVPTASSVRVAPLALQVAGVPDTTLTAKPELALATKAGAATPKRWSPTGAKLMLCASIAADTPNVTATGAAAA
jgi:hypothetical protein